MTARPSTTIATEGEPPQRLRVMIVDDSRVQRRILSSNVSRAGHEVIEAEDGDMAVALCHERAPDLIISDWMMPGLTGPELCLKIRGLGLPNYVYFILLTSRAEKSDVASGLGTGADDFLTKPVNGDELRARIMAGQRILAMERELKRKNGIVSATLAKLQELYDSINRDLMQARKLQQSLVRETHRKFGGTEVSLLLRPSGHVGGDLVGFFPINERRIAVFGIDVSGHGITSAMMTARLASYLSGSSPDHNVALVQDDALGRDAHPPHVVAAMLNHIVLSEMETETYFTLAYADIDLIDGAVRIVQAGHPNPAILRQDGRVEFVGTGGLPIGMFEGATYESFCVELEHGDRLLLISDGVTEAVDSDGQMLGDNGLATILDANKQSDGEALLHALIRDLSSLSGDEFSDDVSAVLVRFGGQIERH